MKDADAAAAAEADGAGPSADSTGAAPMEAEETVMQKKKRTVKKAVPMEACTLSISDQSVMVGPASPGTPESTSSCCSSS